VLNKLIADVLCNYFRVFIYIQVARCVVVYAYIELLMFFVKRDMDVSSFFLFEAMGDSEEDLCDTIHPMIMGDRQGDNIAAMAEDDAESCSYDLSDSPGVDELHDCDLLQACVDDECDDDDDDDDDEEEEAEEEEEEEGHSYPAWAAEHNWKLAAGRRKSSVSVDSSEELMDEEEKNRLFWEACLAS